MDPLSLLKEFLLSGRLSSIQKEGDRINFGGSYIIAKGTSTGFKNALRQDYTLDAVLNLVLNRNLTHPEYLKASNEKKIGAVSLTDRKKLLEFLDGKGELQLDVPEGAFAVPAPRGEIHEEPAAKKARLEEEEGEIAGLESLVRQERQLRNRNTMLITPNKSFVKVIDIVHKAMLAYRTNTPTAGPPPAVPSTSAQPSASRQHQQAKPPPVGQHRSEGGRAAGAGSTAIPIKPSGRFEREVMTDQLKAMTGDAGLGDGVISMYGAYNSSSGAGGAQQKLPPPSSHPHGSGASRPPSGSSGKPSSASASKHQAPPTTSRPQPHGSRPAPVPKPSAGPAEKPKGGVPIIIVPSGLTALMNLFNAKQFFEAGAFETSQAAQQRMGGTKQSMVVVTRTIGKPGGKGVPYHIMDKAPERNHDDWRRVVAVVVQGAKWQFKDWPFKGSSDGDLSEVFSSICGFYLHYTEDKIPEAVANWNVRKLGLHREQRHLDMTVALDIFRHLDTFLMAKKSPLSY